MTAPDAMRAKYTVPYQSFASVVKDGSVAPDAVTLKTVTMQRLDTDAMLRDLTRLTQIETALATLDAWFKAHPDHYGEDGWIMYDSAQRLIIARQYGYEDISAPSVAELIPKLDTLTPAGGAKDADSI